jgi:hypothetical protein
MIKATTENFIKMYFSGLRVQIEIYLMDEWVGCWWNCNNGDEIYIVSPQTHHKYLKFVEEFEKNKPLLAELR